MRITFSKILALAIAIVILSLAALEQGADVNLLRSGLALLFPLVLIWFPDELGSLTGAIGRGGNINVETPPVLVSTIGWMLLIGLPAFAYLFNNP